MSSILTRISRSEAIPQCSKARRVQEGGVRLSIQASSQGLHANGTILNDNPNGQAFQSIPNGLMMTA